jgi:hypothetical protein
VRRSLSVIGFIHGQISLRVEGTNQ